MERADVGRDAFAGFVDAQARQAAGHEGDGRSGDKPEAEDASEGSAHTPECGWAK